MKNKTLWGIWIAGSLALALCLLWGVSFDRLSDEAQPLKTRVRALYSPAALTPGHAQIGLQCTSCHGDKPFDAGITNETCTQCHQRNDDNKLENTHPQSKFEDPANADRLKIIAADKCVTCHSEHQPGAHPKIGVTQPEDFCVACHVNIAKDTPSHDGMAFNTCTNAGCHSYHDNRATYRKLLKRNIDKGDPAKQRVPLREFSERHAEFGIPDNPHGKAHPEQAIDDCQRCHQAEAETFKHGKHGMRAAAGLAPMSPEQSSLPFTPDAHQRTLGCTSCHDGSRPDTVTAAVEACTSCHNDEHTRAYAASRHAALWKAEVAGKAPPGSGVSCATCHMPRMQGETPDGHQRIIVSHDNTANLRPIIKQAKVCTTCHSLQFTHDALADKTLANQRNFNGQPTVHVRSIEMEAARQQDGK